MVLLGLICPRAPAALFGLDFEDLMSR